MVNFSVFRPLLYQIACPSRMDPPAEAKALLALAASPQPKGMDNTLLLVRLLTLLTGWFLLDGLVLAHCC
jgi:hypothetical protein